MEPAPDPAAGEVLVRVAAVGICGSDVHWYNEGAIGDARLGRPLVLGHEASGVIVDGPRAGTRVAIDPAIACERCELCLEGRPNLCAGVRFSGHGMTDGSLRELMAWPERCLVPIPDALDAVEAALLEPLGVALHATDLGRSAFGGSVGVYGCGPIGLLLVQLCQLARVSAVFASDVLPHRVEAARRLGATAFDVSSPQGRSALVAATGSGVDVAFEMSGEDDAVDTALETVRPGRTVVLVGIPAHDRTTFTASTARRKGATIKLARRMGRTYPRAIALALSGKLDLAGVVSDRLPLAEYARAFSSAANRDGLKVVIEPTVDPVAHAS